MNKAAENTAYTTSRTELLDWLNSLLKLGYTKVEQCANGAAFCQILDCLFPGSVRMSRIDFDATYETDMLANYKVMQEVFMKKGINRPIPVDQLLKGRYMASLEMLQWMKWFFEQNYEGGEYDGPARREAAKKRKHAATTREPKRPLPPKTPAMQRQVASQRPPMTTYKPAQHPVKTPRTRPTTDDANTAKLKKEIAELKQQMEQLREDNQTLIEERDFYYGKLQKIEDICVPQEEEELPKAILEVLYKTDEERGFVSPDECEI